MELGAGGRRCTQSVRDQLISIELWKTGEVTDSGKQQNKVTHNTPSLKMTALLSTP